jgi:hypothetical protein
MRRTGDEFFNTSEKDLITRAESSLKSIEESRVRSLNEFKKDFEKWKKTGIFSSDYS